MSILRLSAESVYNFETVLKIANDVEINDIEIFPFDDDDVSNLNRLKIYEEATCDKPENSLELTFNFLSSFRSIGSLGALERDVLCQQLFANCSFASELVPLSYWPLYVRLVTQKNSVCVNTSKNQMYR